MRLRLGINTCFAVKRWPRPEDWAPFVADRLGLRLVQHSLDLVNLDAGEAAIERQIDALRHAVDAADLEMESTFTGLGAYSRNLLLAPDEADRAAALDWFERVIAFSGRLGCRTTGGHVGALSIADNRDPTRRAARWSDLGRALDRLAAAAKIGGLDRIVVENLAAAREPSTIADIEDLLRPPTSDRAEIALCLDVGHMCVPGTSGDDRDPYAWLRRFSAAEPMIQLQQSDADGDHHWPFTATRNREGRIDADRVIDALEAGGAESADLILEVIPAFEQDDELVVDDLRASVDYWRDSLDRRGVLATD